MQTRRTLDPGRPVIALTFDDGPCETTTVAVLDLLEKYNAAATFFVIGDSLTSETEAIVRRAYDMGCEIGNHSRTHQNMSNMTPDEITAEVIYTSEHIMDIVGEPARVFRAPYMAVADFMFKAVGLPFICGSSPQDWNPDVSAGSRIEHILTHAKDGQIFLLHDFPGNTQTVEALKTVLPALTKQGYQFATVSEMFAFKDIEPETGRVYDEII